MSNSLSMEEFKEALPKSLKRAVSQELLDEVNAKIDDPDLYEHYRENMLSYSHVMTNGKFKLTGYVDAVKYVTHKTMMKTNRKAFEDTFPSKITKWIGDGLAAKDINSYVSAYNGSKLVKLLYEQVLTPVYIVNQDILQRAINTQAELMLTARSEKVRSDAANSLMTHLKAPEVAKIELDLGAKTDSSIAALRASTQDLVELQHKAINDKLISATAMAQNPLAIVEEAEYEEAD